MLPRRLRTAVLAAALSLVPTTLAIGQADAAPAKDQGAPGYYDSGLAPTPYLGWNNYFGIPTASESAVVAVADYLASSGLRDAGYRYVWIDGGWNAKDPRDAGGNLVADPARFPHGLSWLTSYLHGKGFRAGIYTDAGASDGENCAAGSLGHYEADTKQFAAWQFDAVKVDFLCGIAQHLDPAVVYPQFSAALQQAGRPMLLNICDPVTGAWGDYPAEEQAGHSYAFGPTVADSWRTDTDVAFGSPTAGEWPSVLRNMDDNAAHPEAQGPGHYNDPDYLIPMRRLADGSLELTQEESTTQFVMWAEMASPLIIGSDPRTLPQSMLDVLKNPEIIGVDQDPLDIQGVRVASNGSTDTYSKVLSGQGNRSVVLLNRGGTATPVRLNFADAGLAGEVSVRDLRARADRGPFTGSYTVTVPAHGTAMLRLHGSDLVPGTDLGGRTTASPAIVRTDDAHAVAFTRGQNGALQTQTLNGGSWPGRWNDLGGPTGNEILGQPAAYGSADGRIDVFVRGLDNAAYQRSFTGGQWGPWRALGGHLSDAPTVAFTSPAAWTLFARGADGEVWSRTNAGNWSSVGAPDGLSVYGRPGAAIDSGGTTYVAVRANDDSVWVRSQDAGGTWSAWSDLGGVVSGSPSLLATEGRVYLFARAGDYTLWQVNHVDGAWGGWFKRTEFASNSFAGALGTAAGANGSAWAAVRGPDDRVHLTSL